MPTCVGVSSKIIDTGRPDNQRKSTTLTQDNECGCVFPNIEDSGSPDNKRNTSTLTQDNECIVLLDELGHGVICPPPLHAECLHLFLGGFAT